MQASATGQGVSLQISSALNGRTMRRGSLTFFIARKGLSLMYRASTSQLKKQRTSRK